MSQGGDKTLPRKEENEKVKIAFPEEDDPDPGDQHIDEDEFADTLRMMRSFLKRFGQGKSTTKRTTRSSANEETPPKKHKSNEDIPKSRKRLSKKDNIKTHD